MYNYQRAAESCAGARETARKFSESSAKSAEVMRKQAGNYAYDGNDELKALFTKQAARYDAIANVYNALAVGADAIAIELRAYAERLGLGHD